MTDLWSLSNISRAKVWRFFLILTNYISNCCNGRFLKSFLGHNQENHLFFSESFNLSPMHLFSYLYFVLNDAPKDCGIIWGFPKNYKMVQEFGGLQTFLEPWDSLVHLKSKLTEDRLWPELTPGLHCQHNFWKGHQIQHTSGGLTPTPCCEFHQTLYDFLGFRWYKPLLPHL